MSSCFFSSRLKMRISVISVAKKRFSTAFPKEPVPPVIKSVDPLFINLLALINFIFKKIEHLLSLISRSFIIINKLYRLKPYLRLLIVAQAQYIKQEFKSKKRS